MLQAQDDAQDDGSGHAGDQQPPADLQSRHLWAPGFPSFESPGAVNVKAAPYGAQGDGRADDTAALQRAVDENEIVFLPKGCYLLTQPLELKPQTKLIGVGQTISLLVPAETGAFANAERGFVHSDLRGGQQPLHRPLRPLAQERHDYMAAFFERLRREVKGLA